MQEPDQSVIDFVSTHQLAVMATARKSGPPHLTMTTYLVENGQDLVTVRDVSAVAQRLEMVRRIAGEIESYVVELGTDGRLLTLQLDELIAGVEPDRELTCPMRYGIGFFRGALRRTTRSLSGS